MRKFLLCLLLSFVLSGCARTNFVSNSETRLDACLTQANFKSSFDNLKKIILGKGTQETLYKGYTHTKFSYKNISLNYRVSGEGKNILEEIGIGDSEKNVGYLLLKANDGYGLHTTGEWKGDVAKQKFKEAQNHYCNVIIGLKNL